MAYWMPANNSLNKNHEVSPRISTSISLVMRNTDKRGHEASSQLPYLLVYKSTFYDLNFSPKNGPQLIHKSYAKKKKIGFEGLKKGIDLYMSSTYTRVNTVYFTRRQKQYPFLTYERHKC